MFFSLRHLLQDELAPCLCWGRPTGINVRAGTHTKSPLSSDSRQSASVKRMRVNFQIDRSGWPPSIESRKGFAGRCWMRRFGCWVFYVFSWVTFPSPFSFFVAVICSFKVVAKQGFLKTEHDVQIFSSFHCLLVYSSVWWTLLALVAESPYSPWCLTPLTSVGNFKPVLWRKG